jgi:hypothetical protein
MLLCTQNKGIQCLLYRSRAEPDSRRNVIYEVEDGDYAKEVRKIFGRKLVGTKIYQYVVLTENYFFEFVTASEPAITLM